jgi:hypothetical protein
VRSLREGGEVMQALELLLRLRQASCDPALVPGQRDAGEAFAHVVRHRRNRRRNCR